MFVLHVFLFHSKDKSNTDYTFKRLQSVAIYFPKVTDAVLFFYAFIVKTNETMQLE